MIITSKSRKAIIGPLGADPDPRPTHLTTPFIYSLFDGQKIGAKAQGCHEHGQVPNGGVADRHG